MATTLTAEGLRGARIALRLSQTDLARLLGVLPHHVSEWERGVTAIPYPAVFRLAIMGLTPIIVASIRVDVMDALHPEPADQSAAPD